MSLQLLIVVGVNVALGACTIDAQGKRLDFTSLGTKPYTFCDESGEFCYDFLFCAEESCDHQQPPTATASFCQHAVNFPDKMVLGKWNDTPYVVWTKTDDGAIVEFQDGMYCDPVRANRTSKLRIHCGDWPAKFVGFTEIATCVYEGDMNVPSTVCTLSSSCCAPPVYFSTRIEDNGTISVVQADNTLGNWYDSNLEGKGMSLLCVKAYNRCFTFNSNKCATSQWQPAPTQCFGDTSTWSVVKQGLLVFGSTIQQTAWYSKIDQSYVVTMPLGDGCVVVSGNRVGTSFEFGLLPNATLWNVPPSCIKLL